jgi:hypothetical protein
MEKRFVAESEIWRERVAAVDERERRAWPLTGSRPASARAFFGGV